MHQTRNSRLAMFAVSVMWIAGCATTTQVTTAPPVSTGRIEGSVQLVEMDCAPSTASSGVTVTLLGTNISALTDSAGNWTLDSVPAGTYTIRMSRPGFGGYDAWPLQCGGTGTDTFYRRVNLARIRNWKVTLPPATVRRNIFIAPTYSDTFFECADTPRVVDSLGNDVTNATNLYWFVGRTPSFNFEDESSWVNFGNGTGGIYPNLGNPREHSGATLYLVACAEPCENEVRHEYYSGDTLKSVLTALGPPSNVVKFVLP